MDFMRTEVWHAISVHFPIALLIFSTLTMLISFFIKIHNRRYWQNGASLLLFVGVITGWIAIYTGNIAEGIVSRKICDPTVLKDHEIAAKTMIYFFTAAAGFALAQIVNLFKPPIRVVFIYLVMVLMLTGSGYLVYAGHLGARLVYQQGAGVYKHTIDCAEFE